jgi:hypothetical protein
MKYITHKPTARDIIIWFMLLSLIAIVPLTSGFSFNGTRGSAIYLIPLLVFPALLLFNLAVRYSLAFKGYFTSRFNPFTAKIYTKKSSDIPPDLLFDKLAEVIRDSSFRLVRADKESFTILATASISLKSWGENLYISLSSDGDNTTIHFWTATVFQIVSWGKNASNLEELFAAFEASLTV